MDKAIRIPEQVRGFAVLTAGALMLVWALASDPDAVRVGRSVRQDESATVWGASTIVCGQPSRNKVQWCAWTCKWYCGQIICDTCGCPTAYNLVSTVQL